MRWPVEQTEKQTYGGEVEQIMKPFGFRGWKKIWKLGGATFEMLFEGKGLDDSTVFPVLYREVPGISDPNPNTLDDYFSGGLNG